MATQGVTGTTGTTSAISQDQFLKLLTTQLQNQNPLDPMSNSDFAAQLAQFSTLQGMQTLNASFSDMLLLQQMTQGANLIGKTAVFNKPDSSGLAQGTVSSVNVVNGKLQLLIGGTTVPLSQVQGFTQGPG